MAGEVCFPRVKNVGLRGIPVADTKVSYIDGAKGELQYRGFKIQDLAQYSTFTEVIHLLLYGELPGKAQLEPLSQRLAAARAVPEAVIASLRHHPKHASPMDVLQGAVPFLAGHDADLVLTDKAAVQRQSERLIARLPTVVAAWERIRTGQQVLAPKAELGHAANFLYMLTGKEPSEKAAHIFDVCLVLHADHTFNASTFAAREVASTRAHLYASVAAGVGALSGELHGGANTQVMAMLQQIDGVDEAARFVRARLDAGERVMGMGHAVYTTLDPRAAILKELALGLDTADSTWVEIAERVRETTQEEFRKRKGKDIYPNVDFYSAAVYYQLGIAPDQFTPVFALGRIAGWCAHVVEEKFAEAQEKPELYRPQAEYIGDYCGPQGCTFVPLGEREGA
ncbi:MAG TPA: citrate/2-methylcitrate synthase [Deferrisomatales bacterium]|nr:citrate/2-methylcitrate synthase [Deferrisomatales bacterium]